MMHVCKSEDARELSRAKRGRRVEGTLDLVACVDHVRLEVENDDVDYHVSDL